MLSPHKSRSLLVLQEQGSCHWEAPGFTYTKGRVKRKNERKGDRGKGSGRDGGIEIAGEGGGSDWMNENVGERHGSEPVSE